MVSFDDDLRHGIDRLESADGTLGRMAGLAEQAARLQHCTAPKMNRAHLVIFAADHGLSAKSASAEPGASSARLVALSDGCAPTAVFAHRGGIPLSLVDAGLRDAPSGLSGLRDLSLGAGTRNCLEGPAMTSAQRDAALRHGESIGAAGDCDAMGFGIVGAGAGAVAALLAHRVTGTDLRALVGRGTGEDAGALMRKHDLLEAASARVPDALHADRALVEFGGFDIAMMVGAMMGAARARRLVLVDGFVSTVAAVIAARLDPACRAAMVFCQLTTEPGHALVLDALAARPLLSLGLRSADGAGVALAWPLVQAAAAMLSGERGA